MKNLYQKYGRCVSFDLTFSLINERPLIRDKQGKIDTKNEYLLGFFAGVNQYNKIIIFGYTVTCKHDKDSMNTIFNTFFQNQMQSWPDSFVTDEEISFKYALQDIK